MSNVQDEYLAGYTKEWWQQALRSRRLLRQYNTIDPGDLRGKYSLLQQLLGAVDERVIIEPPFHCDDGKKIFLGQNFYANYNLTILDADTITIGDRVLFGPNVTLSACGHHLHPDDRYQDGHYPITTAPITIQDDVWVGAGCIINMGVTIGKGSVIGAGSIVTKDVPPGVIAVGSPCKVLRPITDADRQHPT